MRGVVLRLKHEIPHVKSTGGRAIVNTPSVAGVIADPGVAPYITAKHDVIGLTKATAKPRERSASRLRIDGEQGRDMRVVRLAG